MSKTLPGHCTKLNKTKRTEASAVMGRQQLYYSAQRQLPNRRKTTTEKVFSWRRNVASDRAFLTDDGRLFHAHAEATGKAQSPSVEGLVDGTTSMAVSAKRRRCRMSTSRSM